MEVKRKMIFLKDPSEELSKEDISELLEEFGKWLKREKKISNYPNAQSDREKRKAFLEQLIRKTSKHPTIRRIADELKLALSGNENLDIIQDVSDFFQFTLGIEVGEKRKDKEIEATPSGIAPRIIGRVAPTIRTPATPTEFTFWVADDENVHVETGSLVTTRNESGVRITGLVSEVQAICDVESVLDSFYAHARIWQARRGDAY